MGDDASVARKGNRGLAARSATASIAEARHSTGWAKRLIWASTVWSCVVLTGPGPHGAAGRARLRASGREENPGGTPLRWSRLLPVGRRKRRSDFLPTGGERLSYNGQKNYVRKSRHSALVRKSRRVTMSGYGDIRSGADPDLSRVIPRLHPGVSGRR